LQTATLYNTFLFLLDLKIFSCRSLNKPSSLFFVKIGSTLTHPKSWPPTVRGICFRGRAASGQCKFWVRH